MTEQELVYGILVKEAMRRKLAGRMQEQQAKAAKKMKAVKEQKGVDALNEAGRFMKRRGRRAAAGTALKVGGGLAALKYLHGKSKAKKVVPKPSKLQRLMGKAKGMGKSLRRFSRR